MAFPSFSKTGVTTMTFSRGDIFPTRKPVQARQRIGKSESGQIQVATLSLPEYLHLLTFTGLATSDYTNLLTFLTDDDINFAENTFTYTDVNGSTYTVRYLDGALDAQETSAGQWMMTLTLREEIP